MNTTDAFVLGTVFGGMGASLIPLAVYAWHRATRQRRLRRRLRQFRVVAEYTEPYFRRIVKSYPVQFPGPLDQERIEQIRHDLQAREQAEQLPLLVSITEIET